MQPGIYRPEMSFDKDFTIIPNAWIRNTGLTVNANFLLIYLLTHEIGYNITFGQIEREIGLGLTAIRKAVGQLKDAGWLETHQTKDERGYNAGLVWILVEPTIANPTLANPTLANPTLEKRGAIENNLIKKTTIKENKDISSSELDGEFSLFWNAYPRKVGKGAAKKAFDKAVDEFGTLKILAGVNRFANDPNKPEQQFIPHPATWLNEQRWDDDPYPERILDKDTIAERLAEMNRQKSQAQREATLELLEQQKALDKFAAPPPTCIHGKNLLLCKNCLKNVTSTE